MSSKSSWIEMADAAVREAQAAPTRQEQIDIIGRHVAKWIQLADDFEIEGVLTGTVIEALDMGRLPINMRGA